MRGSSAGTPHASKVAHARRLNQMLFGCRGGGIRAGMGATNRRALKSRAGKINVLVTYVRMFHG